MIQGVILSSLAAIAILNAGKSLISDILIGSITLLLSVVWLYRVIIGETRKFSPIATIAFKIHLFYLVLVTIAFFKSVSYIESIIPWGNQIGVFAFIWLSYSLTKQKTFIRQLATVLGVLGTILSLISFVFLFFTPQIPFITRDINFFYPVYGHNRLAEYLLLTLPLTAYLVAQNKGQRKYHLMFVIQLVALVTSLSRSGLAVAALGPFVFALFSKGKTNPFLSHLKKISLIGISLLLVLLPVWLNAEKNTDRRFENIIERVLLKPPFVGERLDYFRYAIDKIAKKPLFGYGPGTFHYSPENYLADTGKITMYAHNSFLQLAYENGVPAAITFLIFIFSIVGAAMKLPGLKGRGFLAKEKVSLVRLSSSALKAEVFSTPAIKRRASDSSPITNPTPFILTSLILSFTHGLIDFDWQIPAIQITAVVLLLTLLPTKKKGGVSGKQIWPAAALSWIPLSAILLLVFHPFFGRPYYQGSISIANRLGQKEVAEKLIQSWARVDSGNGQMYYWRAGLSFQRGDYKKATEELIQSAGAPMKNTLVNQDTIMKLLEKYLEEKLPDQQAILLIELLYRSYFPHDFFSLRTDDYQNTLFKSIDKATSNENDTAYTAHQKSILYYLRYARELNRGMAQFERYHPYIEKAVAADPGNDYFQAVAGANRALVNREANEIDAALEKISAFTKIGNQKADAVTLLTSYLRRNDQDL